MSKYAYEYYQLNQPYISNVPHNAVSWAKIETLSKSCDRGPMSFSDLLLAVDGHDQPGGPRGFILYCCRRGWLCPTTKPIEIPPEGTNMHKCLLTDDELENLREYQQGNEQNKLVKQIAALHHSIGTDTSLLKIGKIMLSLARGYETEKEFDHINRQIRLFRAELKSVTNLDYSVGQFEGDIGTAIAALEMLKAKIT
jgi:hypothetical protein